MCEDQSLDVLAVDRHLSCSRCKPKIHRDEHASQFTRPFQELLIRRALKPLILYPKYVDASSGQLFRHGQRYVHVEIKR